MSDQPDDEQGILPEQTEEEKKLDMDTGKKDEEVYDDPGRDQLTDDSEIEPWEEGFMKGAEGKGKLADCAHCGKPLEDSEGKANVIEREINGDQVFFCSNECAGKGISS